jgi:hypothetical protein
MRPDFESKSEPSDNGTHRFTPGTLELKTTSYLRKSHSSVRTIKLQYNPGLSLQNLLDSFMNYRVQLFGFIYRDDKFFGCRDFV